MSEMPEIQSMPNTVNVTKTKKRKPEEDPDVTELKHRCKFHCKDIKEWRTVSKYNKIKLEEYLSDRTFMDSAQMCQNFSHVALETYAFILDKVVKVNGFEEQEMNSDVTLKDAISREMIEIVTKITNRIQILILTSVNIFNGKKKQLKDVSSANNHSDQFHFRSPIEVIHESGTEDRQCSSEPDPNFGRRDEDEEFTEEDLSRTD